MAQGLDAGQVCLFLCVCMRASLCFSVCLCSCAYVALYNSPLTNSLMVMTQLLKILQGENNGVDPKTRIGLQTIKVCVASLVRQVLTEQSLPL